MASDLRATLIKLHKKHQIFDGVTEKVVKAASEAADIGRVMCRDVYNLRKLEVTDHKVQHLVDMIELPTKGDGTSGDDKGDDDKGDDICDDKGDDKGDDEQTSGIVSFPDFDSLVDPQQAADDSDVEFVNMSCKCPECSKVDTSVNRGSPPIPSARSGGQRIETVGKQEKKGRGTAKKKAVSAKIKKVLNARIKLPIKILERKTSKCGKQPEMYILHSVAAKKNRRAVRIVKISRRLQMTSSQARSPRSGQLANG